MRRSVFYTMKDWMKYHFSLFVHNVKNDLHILL